jgi:hypothetical protein
MFVEKCVRKVPYRVYKGIKLDVIFHKYLMHKLVDFKKEQSFPIPVLDFEVKPDFPLRDHVRATV